MCRSCPYLTDLDAFVLMSSLLVFFSLMEIIVTTKFAAGEKLEKARAIETFYRFFERYERITGESFYKLPNARTESTLVAAHKTRFLDNLDDDFNTGGAVGTLFELLTELNKFADISNPRTTLSSEMQPTARAT